MGGNPETKTDPTGHCFIACAVVSAVSSAVQTVSTVVAAVAPVALQVAGTVTGVSSMISDVGTIVSAAQQGNLLAVGLAVGDLALNVAMDASMATGAGEAIMGLHAAAEVGEHLVADEAGHMAEGALAHEAEEGVAHEAEDGVASELTSTAEECGGLSFAADTLVTTPRGLVPIAALRTGDHVKALDPSTRTASTRTVQATYVHQDTDLLDVTLRTSDGPSSTDHGTANTSPHDETIHTTANHPWLTADRGWKQAGSLTVGERVLRADGSTAEVVVLHNVAGTAPMYDLTVSALHDFAVGSGAYVVHNNNCNPSSSTLDRHLGGEANDGMQAHHLIPRELRTHDLVQLAMRGGFDMDEKANGVLVRDAVHAVADQAFHNGSHHLYSAMVRRWLDESMADLGSRGLLTPDAAAEAVRSVASNARDWVLNSVGRIA